MALIKSQRILKINTLTVLSFKEEKERASTRHVTLLALLSAVAC